MAKEKISEECMKYQSLIFREITSGGTEYFFCSYVKRYFLPATFWVALPGAATFDIQPQFWPSLKNVSKLRQNLTFANNIFSAILNLTKNYKFCCFHPVFRYFNQSIIFFRIN